MIDESLKQEHDERVTYLDVCEQQLEASIVQAQATIASCTSALTTVRLLRAQLKAAQKIADERRQQQGATNGKQPSTFGRKNREALTHGE